MARDSVGLKEALSLYKVSELISTSLSLERILELVIDTALIEVKADAVTLHLEDNRSGQSVVTEARGPTVYAVEREPDALKWLRRNVLGLGVVVIEGDVTDPAVLSELDGRVDLVLCNPPYVPEIGAAGLPAEVTRHDPHVAVYGGTDGLDVIRPLIGRVANLLRPGGAVAVEHEDVHAYVVPTLVHADGRFVDVNVHHDLAQRPRFTTAGRADEPTRMADFTS